MCGICGIFGFNDKQLVKSMAAVLKHRGPDDEGFYFNDNVALGHRRLSVIDIEGSHQPVHNEDESIWIVYNGEVYNFQTLRQQLIQKGHRFYTSGDTEVIVHAYEEWGEDCVAKLNGMFAFAIYDNDIKSLFLARDRLGIKPLYYLIRNSKFLFASEEKAILEFEEYEPAVNIHVLPYFLGYGYENTHTETLFRDIKKLPPGHILSVNSKGTEVKKYWDIEAHHTNESEEFYAERLLSLLKRSVERHLISDVPLGVYLSGGLDSSSIVGLMSQLTDNIKTFSVGFGEGIKNELKYSRVVADHFNTDHKEIIVEPEKMNILEEIIWYSGTPINDFAIIPVYLMSKEAKKDVTVILTGDGGDEVFGGYNKTYKRHMKVKNMGKYLGITSGLVSLASQLLPSSKIKYDLSYAAKLWKDAGSYMLYTPAFREDEFPNLLVRPEPLEKNVITFRDCFKYSFGDGMTLFDLSALLPNAFLPKVDRATMASGVEARVPLLDQEVVEFAFTIPYDLKIKNNIEKYTFRKAMTGILPQAILKREKRGFGYPFNLADRNLREYAESLLDEKTIRNQGYFKPDYIRKMLKNPKNLSHREGLRLWSLVSFQLWHKRFIEGYQ